MEKKDLKSLSYQEMLDEMAAMEKSRFVENRSISGFMKSWSVHRMRWEIFRQS